MSLSQYAGEDHVSPADDVKGSIRIHGLPAGTITVNMKIQDSPSR